MPHLNSGSVTPQKSQLSLSLPAINGFVEKSLTQQEFKNALTRVSNPAHKIMIDAIHNNAGIQSDELADLTGVTNIAQYRKRLNERLQPIGFEARCFQVPGQSRSAAFFHWHFVEYKHPKQTVPPVQSINVGVSGANEDTLQ
ncbi:TPA: hypothetical protein RQK93_004010 [Vibrio vulnificus]|uniref:hypothetical protein n=1 Tax=Vibrio vulnificus TaxID=672 RepID=UPI0015F88204|nr:hypothetical protein [Vibrio vulnificus]EJA3295926.1 hypothetical protein [Vibrio vulnificus]QMV35575.1 hypothetical protein F6X00_03365 [Vibrio vulnificus]HAS6409456.1 hypothetical protein [Vibrio vulnificus]HAS6414300.1 hypothetical protein [Vibrio vulnificus]HDY7891531.1 hypothetical protein [Vibrio vulnificus]